LEELLDAVWEQFRGESLKNVYKSFDAVPVSRKSKEMFIVLGVDSMQIGEAFPDGRAGACAFSAVFRVSVLIPTSQPLEIAEEYFYSVAVPRMEEMGCVLCEVLPPKADAMLDRVVMAGKFRLGGVYLREVE
jgi:hypothetical protein